MTTTFSKSILLLCFLTLFFRYGYAQKEYMLTVIPAPTTDKVLTTKLIKKINYKTTFQTPDQRDKELAKILFGLQDDSYLAASFDSIASDSLAATVFLNPGNRYEWLALKKGNVDEAILNDAGFKERYYRGKPVYYKNVRKIQEGILVWCENNGYPFATIKLDSVTINNKKLSAKLKLEKGLRQSIDSVVLKGSARIAPVYLYNYLSIKPGSGYNEAVVKKISSRVKELPFLTETKPFDVSFSDKKTRLFLYLDNRKASQFDFVAGLVPDPVNAAKLNFTGDAHLKLQNSLGRGEVAELNWKTPAPLTQDLKLSLLYPFLLNSPFGIDLKLSLYKKDTTYIDVERNIGVQYLLLGGNYFKVFYRNKTSSLLNIKQFRDATVLPPFADISLNSYGLGYKMEKLDYRYNPRKGYSAEATGEIGTRTITKNSQLSDSLYNKVNLNVTQYNFFFVMDYYFPLSARVVINLGNRSARIVSPNVLQNELFRIGGLKTLRGFDEESILASTYSMMKAEYRFLIDQNSYLFGFFNWTYYENKRISDSFSDRPYGFGTGITFETKLGLFSFSYAIGKQLDNPLPALTSGKIHFGIISYF